MPRFGVLVLLSPEFPISGLISCSMTTESGEAGHEVSRFGTGELVVARSALKLSMLTMEIPESLLTVLGIGWFGVLGDCEQSCVFLNGEGSESSMFSTTSAEFRIISAKVPSSKPKLCSWSNSLEQK